VRNKRSLQTLILRVRGEAVKTNILQDEIFEAARKPHEQNAPSYGISYINTQLAKHEDNEAPFTHLNMSHSHFRSPECSSEIATVFSYGKIVPSSSLKRMSERKRELKSHAID
jgi:hypothetical protein